MTLCNNIIYDNIFRRRPICSSSWPCCLTQSGAVWWLLSSSPQLWFGASTSGRPTATRTTWRGLKTMMRTDSSPSRSVFGSVWPLWHHTEVARLPRTSQAEWNTDWRGPRCYPAYRLVHLGVEECSEKLLRQQSYTIKNQLGHPKTPPRWFFMA